MYCAALPERSRCVLFRCYRAHLATRFRRVHCQERPRASHSMSHTDHVVICGGGIIGVATAYYLTLQGVKPMLVERTGIGCGASGKAGGFLAQDWTDELAQVSYELHEQLAKDLQTDVGYRPVQSLAVAVTAKGTGKKRSAQLPEWLDGKVSGGQVLGIIQSTPQVHPEKVLGTTQSTAQVHPEKLTKAMMAAAEGRGAVVKMGCVQAVNVTEGPLPQVTGVTVDGDHLPATAVVLALGPWTNTLGGTLRLPHIAGQLGHSLVLKPAKSEALPADCLFVSWQSRSGKVSEPEIFPRADGTVWCCGENSMVTPPEDASQVQCNPGAVDAVQEVAAALSSDLASAEVLQAQACIRPLSPDGTPIIGQHPNVSGVYIATGHSCWGILNGPASGKALAELICTGEAKCVDLSSYNPTRLIRPNNKVKQNAHVQNYERTHLSDQEPVDPDSHFPESRGV